MGWTDSSKHQLSSNSIVSVRAGVRLVGAMVVLLADGACDEKLGPFAPRVRREDHRGRVVAGTRAQPVDDAPMDRFRGAGSGGGGLIRARSRLLPESALRVLTRTVHSTGQVGASGAGTRTE